MQISNSLNYCIFARNMTQAYLKELLNRVTAEIYLKRCLWEVLEYTLNKPEMNSFLKSGVNFIVKTKNKTGADPRGEGEGQRDWSPLKLNFEVDLWQPTFYAVFYFIVIIIHNRYFLISGFFLFFFFIISFLIIIEKWPYVSCIEAFKGLIRYLHLFYYVYILLFHWSLCWTKCVFLFISKQPPGDLLQNRSATLLKLNFFTDTFHIFWSYEWMNLILCRSPKVFC